MKRFRYTIAIFSLVLGFTVHVNSQAHGNESDILQRLKGEGSNFSGFRLEMDPYIEDNYYRHLLYNQKNAATMGYRIRIFSMSGHDAFERANQARARFLSKYENIPSYITYDTPDYKVYVGDCRTRSEVLKLFSMIKNDFPYAFLVNQPININSEN